MVYVNDYTVSKVFWKNYIEKYTSVYDEVYNQMKEKYSDEGALQASVATVMIAFTKAAGMDIPGVVTWDESEAVSDVDFKTFADLKVKTEAAKQTSAPVNSGGQKPYYGNKTGGQDGQKKPYTGPTDGLKGKASAPQINKINEFLNSNNSAVSDVAVDMLRELDVASPEELSKQDASNIIQACFNAGGKSKYQKG